MPPSPSLPTPLARISQEIDTLLSLKVLEVPVATAHVATKEFLPPASQPK